MEDKFLEVAKQAAIEAGKVIQNYSNKFGEKIIKDGDKTNFTTRADLESEKMIVKILADNFPDHSIVAEEGGGINKRSEFVWMVDPLDGTLPFTQKIPLYAVSIGLLKNGQPILGVINHISFKNLYWAQKGKGAFKNGKKILVSKKTKLETAVASLGFGHRHRMQLRLDLYVNKLITKIGYPFVLGSAAVSLAFTANGLLDFYINHAWQWDLAAGAVIVKEAGGEVTDFAGNEPDWSQERLNIIASNGLIHDEILEALKG